jgi:hypothetical protein
MQNVNHQAGVARGARRIGFPAFGMLVTVPVAALLWLAIIAAAYELFKWATPA